MKRQRKKEDMVRRGVKPLITNVPPRFNPRFHKEMIFLQEQLPRDLKKSPSPGPWPVSLNLISQGKSSKHTSLAITVT
jgi:hypothetical protein